MIKLTGALITLRNPTEEDWHGWLYAMNDLETMKALIPYFKREVWTALDLKQRYETMGVNFSVVRNTDQKIVGQMGIKDLEPGVKGELGTILHREVWGTGTAEECKLLAFEYAFGTLNLKQVYLYTDHKNERAKEHLKKIGIPLVEVTERGLRYNVNREEWPGIKKKLESLLKAKLGERRALPSLS